MFLVGCTLICPYQKGALFQDQQDFSRAFDDFQTTHSIGALQQFIVDYPDSDWSGRARTLVLYSQELDQRKAQVVELRQSHQQLTESNSVLLKINKQLDQQLAQLKTLLIQTEERQ